MPTENLLSVVIAFLAAVIFYRFRRAIIGKLQRFNARNAAKRAEEMHAVFDKYAHYRQTISVADEQIETVTRITAADSRTGQPVERFVFLGVQYATLADAEIARHAQVIAKAREFYMDLDKTFLARRKPNEPLRN